MSDYITDIVVKICYFEKKGIFFTNFSSKEEEIFSFQYYISKMPSKNLDFLYTKTNQ